jgi:alpha-galactosidase
VKITVIGSGSFFFTRQVLKAMVESKVFKDCELALVDTDERNCELMGKFCQKVVTEKGAPIKVAYSTDRKALLPNSDYVILTFSSRNVHYRGTGVHICRKYGIIEASGDTAGPGAVFRVIKEVPRVLEVAKDIEKLCPDAFVLNYINPTNVISMALDRFSKLRNSYGFCNGADEYLQAKEFSEYLGTEIAPDEFGRLEISFAGINHFVWAFGLKLDGVDVWDRFRKGLKEACEKDEAKYTGGVRNSVRAKWDLTEMFDAYPVVIWHTQEYLRYFQGRGSQPQRDFVVAPWDLTGRVQMMRQMWCDIRSYVDGRLDYEGVMRHVEKDMVARLIESREGNLNKRFPIDIRNEGRISNLPDKFIVELYGTVNKRGIDVPAFGDLPTGLLGMTYQMIDMQELALEAAMTGNYHTLVKAVACDPLVMSLSDAKEIAYEFMGVDADDLPSVWDSFWKEESHFSASRFV